jgi:hypothetical protein
VITQIKFITVSDFVSIMFCFIMKNSTPLAMKISTPLAMKISTPLAMKISTPLNPSLQ